MNRVAIVAVLLITLLFLAPIYWIASTAFKPRILSTTIPPTILFQPDVSPFVKLFTKRSQLREQPTPEEYAAAPWWERIVPMRSYVKGWKISPSHYVNQDLATVWLDK